MPVSVGASCLECLHSTSSAGTGTRDYHLFSLQGYPSCCREWIGGLQYDKDGRLQYNKELVINTKTDTFALFSSLATDLWVKFRPKLKLWKITHPESRMMTFLPTGSVGNFPFSQKSCQSKMAYLNY